MTPSQIPVIAIVGRPNVGKSTLFNRLIGERDAIVLDTPGVTRDRKYGSVEWSGKSFTIIDTGGYVPGSEDLFERAIREQAEIAIQEADAVLFVVDGRDGVTPLDRELTAILRKSRKPIWLAVNKIDSERYDPALHEFHELGLGDPLPVAALGGRQVGDLLDAITQTFAKRGRTRSEKRLRIGIIGKPNVGKSSLVNALLGQERNLVTPIPGTTRDPVDSILKIHGEEIVLIDTAGLRRKSKVKESIEFYSTLRTLKALERSDVIVLLLDASTGADKQDVHIVDLVLARRRPAVIAVNKWDLVEKETNTALEFERTIRDRLGEHDYLPVLFISAKTRQRIIKVVEKAKELHAEQQRRISTSKLNKTIMADIERTPPRSSSPKEIKIKYVTQLKTNPPLFAFFCNEPKLVEESYRRFLENRLREHFGFHGVPLGIVFRRK